MIRQLVIIITLDGIQVHGDDLDEELVAELEALVGPQNQEGLLTTFNLHLCG